MTRIDFYFNAESKLQLTCRIAEKALGRRMSILIFAPNDTVAATLNRLMWTINPTGFIPHCAASERVAPSTPIVIASDTTAVMHDDLLLNLDNSPPPSFGRFLRLVEIVSRDDPADIQAARGRFRFYKDQGYPINHYDLSRRGAGNE